MSKLTNQTYRSSVGTEPHLERRLSLVGQSFTGFDWGTRPALSHEVIKHHVKTGRELHARTVRQAFRSLIRGIVGGVRQGAEALQRWHLSRVTYRELMALDDHLLHDIGLHRDQIPAVFEGLGRNESNPVAESQAYVATVAGRQSDAANDDRPDLAA
jgi:uncharacterized protein YjiS (DUF1127 family)